MGFPMCKALLYTSCLVILIINHEKGRVVIIIFILQIRILGLFTFEGPG